MQYLLITPKGKAYTFHIRALAETYQQAYGGTLTDHSIITEKTCQAPVEVYQSGQVLVA
jgi:hypothetical protein